eukprot:2982333-Prymnesium_polylepis.1
MARMIGKDGEVLTFEVLGGFPPRVSWNVTVFTLEVSNKWPARLRVPQGTSIHRARVLNESCDADTRQPLP